MTAADAGGVTPAAPSGTAELFGERWHHAEAYADLLCREGVEWGLIGPRETARIWERHVRNSLALGPFIRPDARVIDLGSGAGLPGIPLTLARPDLQMTLLESMARRVQFLEIARERCGLSGLNIEHARAERATATADVIVCRAVAPLTRLLPWAHHLTKGRGTLVALKGRSVADEVAEVDAALRQRPSMRWRPRDLVVHQVERPDPATVLVASWR